MVGSEVDGSPWENLVKNPIFHPNIHQITYRSGEVWDLLTSDFDHLVYIFMTPNGHQSSVQTELQIDQIDHGLYNSTQLFLFQ